LFISFDEFHYLFDVHNTDDIRAAAMLWKVIIFSHSTPNLSFLYTGSTQAVMWWCLDQPEKNGRSFILHYFDCTLDFESNSTSLEDLSILMEKYEGISKDMFQTASQIVDVKSCANIAQVLRRFKNNPNQSISDSYSALIATKFNLMYRDFSCIFKTTNHPGFELLIRYASGNQQDLPPSIQRKFIKESNGLYFLKDSYLR
jgi:hypothetical protein